MTAVDRESLAAKWQENEQRLKAFYAIGNPCGPASVSLAEAIDPGAAGIGRLALPGRGGSLAK
jgi:hypothetical protein